MWVVSRAGVLEGLFDGSALGLIRVKMMVLCVREWVCRCGSQVWVRCPRVCMAIVSGVRL
jgi:hypothetical protein